MSAPPQPALQEVDPQDAADAGPAASASGATDIVAGVLFAAIGGAALVIGRGYEFGTTLRMGSGFMPRLVAGILVFLGLVLLVRGMARGGWRPLGFHWRPILLISAAILTFAFTIDRLGLVVASLLTVCIGAAAETGVRWRQLPIIAVGLSVFCAILFGYVLQVSMPVWPR